jgi:hydrogenase maturation protease
MPRVAEGACCSQEKGGRSAEPVTLPADRLGGMGKRSRTRRSLPVAEETDSSLRHGQAPGRSTSPALAHATHHATRRSHAGEDSCPSGCEKGFSHQPARTLVLGLGNPLLSDDSVGLRVVRRLGPALDARPDIEVAEDFCGGLRTMERMMGFDRAIIVDAAIGGDEPGTIRVTSGPSAAARHCTCAHDADLETAIALGRRAGALLPAPSNIRIVTIEAADVLTFSAACTPAVEAAIDGAADAALTLLAMWR